MNTLFNTLTTELQNEIKSTLSAYPSTSVYKKADGTLYSTNVVCIHTGDYDEFIAEFKEADIFTENEIIINYVESFRDYPTKYKGRRNYKELNGNWVKASLVEGNLILV